MATASDVNTSLEAINEISDESLMLNLSLIEENIVEEIENEMESAIADIQESTTGFLCVTCNKICKSKGGLTLHRRKKHGDSASSSKPGKPKRDLNKIAEETLPCKRLCDLVEEAKAEIIRNDLYTEEIGRNLKDSSRFVCSEKDDLYKEIIKLLKTLLKKGDGESYYAKFYSSIMLRSQSLLKDAYSDNNSKLVMMYLADKILSITKNISSESDLKDAQQISIKDCERGPLNYLTGYCIRNLFQKCKQRVVKQQSSPETDELISLLGSLHIDKEMATSNDYYLIKDKDRGGLWYPKEYLVQIMLTAEMEFRISTEGKQLSHKVNCDEILIELLKNSSLRSKWAMLVEECSTRITSKRSMIFLAELLQLYIKVRIFSFSKDILQKYKLKQKECKKKALRTDMKEKERCKSTV